MLTQDIIKKIKFLSEEEISEIVFRKLLDREKFSILFVNTKVLYHLILDREFRSVIPSNTLFIPSSRFVSFVVSNLAKLKENTPVRESSAIFRMLKAISDYHYRVLLVGRSGKVVSKFKKHISSSIRDSSFNLVGIFGILSKRTRQQKMETMKKMEPDITIVGGNIVKLLKLMRKNGFSDNFSLVLASEGVGVIAGVDGVGGLFRRIEVLLKGVIVLLWFIKEKFVSLFRR